MLRLLHRSQRAFRARKLPDVRQLPSGALKFHDHQIGVNEAVSGQRSTRTQPYAPTYTCAHTHHSFHGGNISEGFPGQNKRSISSSAPKPCSPTASPAYLPLSHPNTCLSFPCAEMFSGRTMTQVTAASAASKTRGRALRGTPRSRPPLHTEKRKPLCQGTSLCHRSPLVLFREHPAVAIEMAYLQQRSKLRPL